MIRSPVCEQTERDPVLATMEWCDVEPGDKIQLVLLHRLANKNSWYCYIDWRTKILGRKENHWCRLKSEEGCDVPADKILLISIIDRISCQF
jgi:hypothetical protein